MNATLEQMQARLGNCEHKSPFSLDNETEYQAWRNGKLERRQALTPAKLFKLDDNARFSRSVMDAIGYQVDAFGFIVFESDSELGKEDFLALNRQCGLTRLDDNLGADEDRVTALHVVPDSDRRAQYIPYTNRELKWHTDGYYNPCNRRINAFALYCVNQAGRGGGNYLFDHEYMYLLIRDQAPELLEILMCDDLMHIPANVQDNRVVRAAESGPVFSITPRSSVLNMRYTSRPQNIVWKSDKRSQQAINLIREILMDSDAVIEIRLQDRQGLVCNNILHGRQAFADSETGPTRLIYRARFHDSIDLARDRDLGTKAGG